MWVGKKALLQQIKFWDPHLSNLAMPFGQLKADFVNTISIVKWIVTSLTQSYNSKNVTSNSCWTTQVTVIWYPMIRCSVATRACKLASNCCENEE